jgi:CheY-like chemotaxis protein
MATLLVVEDDAAIAEPLVRALERERHTVAHAGTGEAALERLGEGTSTSSCSTSACRASTASRSAAALGPLIPGWPC